MGKPADKNKNSRAANSADAIDGGGNNDEDDGMEKCSTSMSNLKLKPREQTKALERCLENLFDKKGSAREKALSSIADIFTNNVHYQFVSKQCITLLHRCLNSIKKGSAREVYLASHVVGLLSITVGCTDGLSCEILEDSVSLISQVLQSASEPLKITSLLECLAVITVVGGNNVEETERSMQLIWQFIHPQLDPHVVASESNSEILTAAISSWSFLLATMDSWSINSKLWRGSISYFLNLLYKDNMPLRMAAGGALALIFEIGNLVKFFDEAEISSGSSDQEEIDGHESMEVVKDTVLNQVRILSAEIGTSDSTEKGLVKSHRSLFSDVSRILEGCYNPETTIKVGGDMLKISTWSQLVQVNYLKRFLGVGFVKHVQENKLLHDFLDFTPNRNRLGGKQHINSDEKVAIRYVYQPEPRNGDDLSQKKLKPQSSVLKAKTQLMNKKRMLSQAKNEGYYAASCKDEGD